MFLGRQYVPFAHPQCRDTNSSTLENPNGLEFKETIAVCCEDHVKHTNAIFGQIENFLMLKRMKYILVPIRAL
jgi:hypothetical protein